MYDTFDDAVTLYNAKYNRKLGDNEWRRVQISGASFYGSQKVVAGESGLSTADEYTVRIPRSKMPDGFMNSAEYNKLSDPTGHWTVSNGDIVVKGLIEDEITQPSDVTAKYDACFTVTGWYDNRRGPLAMQHIKIKGK